MMSVYWYIRKFAQTIEGADELKLHEVKIYFEAPNPDRPSSETMTIQKKKEFEANFIWKNYAILFTKGKDDWYVYTTPLNPWGTRQSGGQEIIASDLDWKLYSNKDVDVTPEEVEAQFRKLLEKPDLHPDIPAVIYVNIHKSVMTGKEGKVYSAQIFEQKFKNDFYVVLRKDKKFEDPFGKLLGTKGEPEEGK